MSFFIHCLFASDSERSEKIFTGIVKTRAHDQSESPPSAKMTSKESEIEDENFNALDNYDADMDVGSMSGTEETYEGLWRDL